MNNLHRNNVSGSDETVKYSCRLDHEENQDIIRNEYDLNRLKERNKDVQIRRDQDRQFEAQKEKDRRELISTQGNLEIKKINAETDAEEKRMRLQNARQNDKEAHELSMEKSKMNHEENKKRMENEQEINRKKADNETMKIKGKIELDLENAREANKRGMAQLNQKYELSKLEIEGKSQVEKMKINNEKIK